MENGGSEAYLASRKTYALNRLVSLEEEVTKAATGIQLENLTIFTVGSYGRLEASPESDIDLFFVYGTKSSMESRRTNEMRLFGRLIDAVERLGFPALSNDAQYLESHLVDDVLESLGSPKDDASNFFTMRMLLLLESRNVYGDAVFDEVIDEIIQSYYRDFPKHEDNFRPWFLLNDIMRFWKTLLLNYEHRRNRSENSNNPAPRVKNFKLKFSRATTCFATIAAIGSFHGSVQAADIKEMVGMPPLQRLAKVAENIPELSLDVDEIIEEYVWFLEQTALPTADLESKFSSREDKLRMFKRASSYGAKLFELIRKIDETSPGLLRALVV